MCESFNFRNTLCHYAPRTRPYETSPNDWRGRVFMRVFVGLFRRNTNVPKLAQ